MSNNQLNGNKTLLEVDGSRGIESVMATMRQDFGSCLAYHIHSVPETDYVSFYEELAANLGTVRSCRPVNDKSTNFSKSRDIRPDQSVYHFYASNTRQPLHTDYAHYPQDNVPDWLMLYCLVPSAYGGRTHLVSSATVTAILSEYRPELIEKLETEIVWSYSGVDGDVVHKKPILKGGQINWNYWQIKPDLNSAEAIEIRDEFFKFLEDIIVAGAIYDFSKVWNKGDAIIFNDKYSLHGRDAFLGDRWLKSHAFFK